MSTFFLIIEVLNYAFAVFLLIKKGERAIIYLPVLIFANNVIEPVFSASIFYAAVSSLILACVVRNGTFYRNNIFAVLLFLYFLYLLPRSSDLTLIRHDVFSVLCFFLSVPLIQAVYKKYDAQVIFKELSAAALIILVLFIVNALMATRTGYAPNAMYGITKGVLFGNFYGAGFNILTSALFMLALKLASNRNWALFIILMVAYTLIMLTLRRSVMLVGSLGIIIAFLTLVAQKEAKQVLVLGSLCFCIGYLIYSNTGFETEFEERYEKRDLADRDVKEEKRFLEYELIYQDMFVDHRYSAWFGFQLFNSAGNYGKGVFEKRTLHSDITSILHSSGLIGFVLYLLMVSTAFRQAWRMARFSIDKLIILYCAIAFIAFTTSGRITETGSMTLIFLILMLPLAPYSIKSSTEMIRSLPPSSGNTGIPFLQY